jgi:pSer/pThr/pTyr-binding forkhead associated (FHA) protein
MTRLHVISDSLRGNTFDLSADYITIGRAADNTICLDHSSVSKHHARLTVDGSGFTLCDLHSTNGTIVNGDKIVSAQLKDGDRITLGEVELHFALAKKNRVPSPSSTVTRLQSNGDSHEADNDSVRPSPSLARLKEFATKSSRILSRLPFHHRPSETSSRPDKNGNGRALPPAVPTMKAEAIPIPVKPSAINPSVFDPPPKSELQRPIPVAVPGPSAGQTKKEQPLVLKPPMPAGPIAIKKPVPSPEKEPSSAAATSPKPAASTDQPRVPAPRKVAAASLYVGMTSVGLLLLIIGYTGESNALKFLGLAALITGLLSLFVLLRSGSIIAPPKRRL